MSLAGAKMVRLRLALVLAAMMTLVAAFSLTMAAPSGAVTAGADVLLRLHSGVSEAAARTLAATDDDLTPLLPEMGIYRLRSNAEAGQALLRLRHSPLVAYAEPNGAVQLARQPNDPDFASRQWALSAINAPAAWDVVTGSSDITIAIIDTGIDLNHPDLRTKLVTGTTFVKGTTSAQDDHGHGTHVAGIATASTNNGIGMAGVSWGALLMPVKVLDSAGSGTYAELINGIYYAASHGAKIINMSLMSTSYSQAVQDAIDYAYGQGALLIAAAGNCGQGGTGCGGMNPIVYPAANSHVLSVAATDDQDRRAVFSTYNAFVAIAAPGVGIYSTNWQNGVSTYYWMSGTSQASPHVAGLAALIWSGRPWLRNSDIEAVLKNTVKDANVVEFPGYDVYMGWGRIDAQRAVDRSAPASAVLPLPAALANPLFTVSWAGSDDNSGLRSYTIQYRDGNGLWQDWLAGISVTQSVFSGVMGHTYYFQSSATDWAGNVEPYPGGEGDARVHLTRCSISGQVRDNRGVAVAGASVFLADEMVTAVSDESGRYELALPQCDGTFAVTAVSPVFGAIPPLFGRVATAGEATSGVDIILPPADNLLRNSNWGFEQGGLAPAWTVGGEMLPVLAPGQGHTGNGAAYLGTVMTATSPAGESWIAITATIPITVYRPTLSFMYRILTMDNGLHDSFEVRVDGQPVFSDSYAGSDYGVVRDLGWRHGWADLGDYAGQTVQVRLVVLQGQAYASYPTGAFVDEVSLGSAAGGRFTIHLPHISVGSE